LSFPFLQIFCTDVPWPSQCTTNIVTLFFCKNQLDQNVR
jgi:hypothetical protein